MHPAGSGLRGRKARTDPARSSGRTLLAAPGKDGGVPEVRVFPNCSAPAPAAWGSHWSVAWPGRWSADAVVITKGKSAKFRSAWIGVGPAGAGRSSAPPPSVGVACGRRREAGPKGPRGRRGRGRPRRPPGPQWSRRGPGAPSRPAVSQVQQWVVANPVMDCKSTTPGSNPGGASFLTLFWSIFFRPAFFAAASYAAERAGAANVRSSSQIGPVNSPSRRASALATVAPSRTR